MKKSFSVLAAGIAALTLFQSCAPEDSEYSPRRRGGFRPPPGPGIPEDPIVHQPDPLNLPPGYQTPGAPNTSGTPGGSGSGYSAVNPGAVPDPRTGPPSHTSPAPPPTPPPSSNPSPAPAPPPAPPKTAEIPYATKVQGKAGWIRSPYDGKLLDATGFLRGEQVADPVSGKIMLVP